MSSTVFRFSLRWIIWAVGFSRDTTGKFASLIEHFNGTAWSVVPSPNPGVTGDQLYAVIAASAKDVWAVGEMSGTNGPNLALIEHWDGSKWSVVQSPPDGLESTLLYSLSGSSGNITAVGSAQNDFDGPHTLVEVEKQGVVSLQNSSNTGTGENDFYGVAQVPANSGVHWAVGATQDAASGNLLTLIEHFTNGSSVQETSPSPGLANGDSLLGSVIALSPTDLWAVGTYDGVNAAMPLVLHGCE